jgi:hypothetical protein
MAVSVMYEDRTLRVVSDGYALLTAWFDTPRPEHLRALVRAAETHHQRLRGQKHVVASILIGGSPDFSDEMRKLTAEVGMRMAPWRAATAHVVLFGGLRGVIARSITSTVLLISRSRAPTKVFDSIDPAIPWLLSHLRKLEDWEPWRLRVAFEAACKTAPGGNPG